MWTLTLLQNAEAECKLNKSEPWNMLNRTNVVISEWKAYIICGHLCETEKSYLKLSGNCKGSQKCIFQLCSSQKGLLLQKHILNQCKSQFKYFQHLWHRWMYLFERHLVITNMSHKWSTYCQEGKIRSFVSGSYGRFYCTTGFPVSLESFCN